jgi:hypothetical protein
VAIMRPEASVAKKEMGTSFSGTWKTKRGEME